ncbi:MAG: hypothetical protein SFU99_06460 [Saprospiraceae bacterium]|nr:hypothetical protein [Saprospiraceae bacterium]
MLRRSNILVEFDMSLMERAVRYATIPNMWRTYGTPIYSYSTFLPIFRPAGTPCTKHKHYGAFILFNPISRRYIPRPPK